MKGPRVLLIDLGGVVVDFQGPEKINELTRGAWSLAHVRDRWWRLPELDALERGRLSPEAFADAFIREWRLDLDREAFLDNFKHWVVRRFDGVAELLIALRPRFRLACLSNVNVVHWQRCLELGVGELFDEHYLSHELGFRKPEPEIYAAAMARLGVDPGRILFFDDLAANVDAARAAGMRVELVRAPGAFEEALRRGGIDCADYIR